MNGAAIFFSLDATNWIIEHNQCRDGAEAPELKMRREEFIYLILSNKWLGWKKLTFPRPAGGWGGGWIPWGAFPRRFTRLFYMILNLITRKHQEYAPKILTRSTFKMCCETPKGPAGSVYRFLAGWRWNFCASFFHARSFTSTMFFQQTRQRSAGGHFWRPNIRSVWKYFDGTKKISAGLNRRGSRSLLLVLFYAARSLQK